MTTISKDKRDLVSSLIKQYHLDQANGERAFEPPRVATVVSQPTYFHQTQPLQPVSEPIERTAPPVPPARPAPHIVRPPQAVNPKGGNGKSQKSVFGSPAILAS